MSNRIIPKAVLESPQQPVTVIHVAGTTNPKPLAGSIAEEVRNKREVALHAIGHQAVGQALKAVPIANSFLVSQGKVLLVLPSFEDKDVTSEADPNATVTRTVTRMRLYVWHLGA